MGTLVSLLALAACSPAAVRLGNILPSYLFRLVFINAPYSLLINAKEGRENILNSDSGKQFSSFLCPVCLLRASFTLICFPYKTRRLVPHSSFVLPDLPEQMANSLGQNLPLTLCLSWVYYLLVIVINVKNVNSTSIFVYWKRWADIRKY